jgi:hypothetical protein
MLDFKPSRSPGYTGNRHDDPPKKLSREQFGILCFVVGMMFALTLSLMWGNV